MNTANRKHIQRLITLFMLGQNKSREVIELIETIARKEKSTAAQVIQSRDMRRIAALKKERNKWDVVTNGKDA